MTLRRQNDPLVLVYIGRFQPFHLGHMKVSHIAASMADRVIFVLGNGEVVKTYTFDEVR